jgi:UDP-N-acetylmuramoylalanine--D-glutamate ligase
LVIGLGVSGIAAVEYLHAQGKSVLGVDQNPDRPDIAKLKNQNCQIQKDTVPIDFDHVEMVVVSPGVPPTHPHYREALARGIEIVGEAELAFRRLPNRCIAITGTNGKTTVTMLVTHVLNASGIKARALGNVGEPLATYAMLPNPKEIVVAELSSYQIETMNTRVFDAGVILNITPDHLDRYTSMEEYARAKCGLSRCMKTGAPLFVYEQAVAEFGHLLPTAQIKQYGRNQTSFFWTDKHAVYREEKIETFLPLSYRQWGIHESENAAAAWLLCRSFGVTDAQFFEACKTFKKPAHRIEYVATIGGIAYFNDSKGTNIDAVVQAVAAMQGPVVLIAGGVDKGASYTPWIEQLGKRVKRIVAIGQAAEKIRDELSGAYPVEIFNSLEAAVKRAASAATAGDFVLLSPGCSSFDMFRDYAHRGEEFKRCVLDLLLEECHES